MSVGEKILAFVKAIGSSRNDDTLREGLSASNEIPLDLARAILFVDLALIDSRFDAREYEFVVSTLKSDLAISDEEAIQLIKTASSMIQFRGSHSFAVELQKKMTLEQRKKIASQLKKLIAADAQEDGFEVYLVKKLGDLLGVDE